MNSILISPKKKHQVTHRLKCDLNFVITTRKENASKEYNNFEKCLQKFNDLYSERGEYISKYFIKEMQSLYDCAETVSSKFNEISMLGYDLAYENYSKLKFYQRIIESIVKEFVELENKSKEIERIESDNLRLEKEHDEELKRIEYESEINRDYCNNIRKMVNHICSQITSDNPAHSQGRLQDLVRFFQGENIPLVGTEKHTFINLQLHPRAKEKCWEFLRKAVVTQAESQFCANIDTVLVFASLLAALLGRFPNEMNAMMAYLETRFSQLLLPPTDHEYHDEEEHLNNLIGIGRLVAAISVALPPTGFICHPDLNPGFLWSLLARMCNRTPASLFTAQAYLGLLEIGSSALLTYYGNQFEKLLIAIQEKFNVPKSLTERSLSLFISNGLANKSFPYPSCLSDKYWLK